MKKICLPLIPLLILALALGCSNDANDDGPDGPGGLAGVDTTANLQGTGDSANDLLSNDSFSKLVVEIAYVEGFRPTEAAMDGFVAYLKQRTFKEDIDLIYNELTSPDEEKLTLEEISDLEKKHRTAYNDGETLAVYIYFSDAPAEEDEEEQGLVTLGAVYRNTSMIIHEVTVRRLANQNFIPTAEVESSTLNHEFGHLFGLVNLGTDQVNDHEGEQTDENGEPVLDDNGNPLGNSHCIVNACLMNAELQFGGAAGKSAPQTAKSALGLKAGCRLSGKSVLKMLSARTAKESGLAPTLGAECILDLRSNGGR
ncbi:MAG TPA: hypothetical protein VFM69_04530 [Pricia sp.]|nr:hypothetical protein [Pricia sp.]